MTAERTVSSLDDDAGSGLIGQVARLFFDRQLTKVEIAGRLGISRFRVARLIDEAVAEGVVRIEFRDAPAQDRSLGRAIQARFGIAGCIVAQADRDETAIARLAADVVDGCLGRGEAIGIAWGSTVGRVVRAMPARSDPAIDVVQLAGSSTRLDAGTDPGDLTLVLADRLGARPHRIHAPAFVESAELRTALMRQPEIADIPRQRRLGHVHPLCDKQLPEVLLTSHFMGPDELQNGRLAYLLSCHVSSSASRPSAHVEYVMQRPLTSVKCMIMH